MGTSAYEQYLAEKDDPSSAYAQYLAQKASGPAKRALSPEQIARLAQGQAEKNAADRVGAGDFFSALALEPLATFAAGVPGAKLAASKAGSLLSGDTMANTQREINDRTSDVPYASAIASGVGTVALAPALPASGMAAGSLLMGADQFLNNDPGSSLLGRAGRGVAGAAGGALVGKYADRLITAGRALVSPTAATVRNRMLADRAKEAKGLFDRALAEGQGKSMPQAVRDWVDSPDIAPIVADLKATRVHENTPVDSPEMLDAIYKVLSDRGQIAKGKLAALVPRNANLGRVAAKDIGLAKEQGLNAIARGPDAPMPTYEDAVNAFRARSNAIDAFDAGYNGVRSGMSDGLPSAKAISRPDRTPESFGDWMLGLKSNVADAENASRGAVSAVRSAKSRKAADAAAKFLRSADAARGINLPNYIQKGAFGGLLAFLP